MTENQNKTAIVIGATGLVGRQTVIQLLENPNYAKVIVLTRRSTEIENDKLEEHLINFDELEKHKEFIKGDVLFSAMGTTINKAKTQENQYRIDYTYQYETARIAAENGVPQYALVSSTGANSASRIFYSRMKGELEENIQKLDFKKIVIVQPSVLRGDRPEYRFGERMGEYVIDGFSKIIPSLKKWASISGEEVAKALIFFSENSNVNQKVNVFKLDELKNLD